MTVTAPSVPQLVLPGQAAAPEGPVDLAPMYLMHRAFRRDLAAFADVVPTVAATDRARWRLVRRRFAFFGTVLHKHHTGEDVAMWPLLAERGADRTVLDALAAEHAGIDPLLDAASADLAALAAGTGGGGATRERLAATMIEMRDALGAHLAHEERDGMALVQQHLSQADWDRLDEVFAKDYRPREVPAVLGWVMSGLTPDQARRLPGANPLLLAFARLMARRFDRQEARVFGTGRGRLRGDG